MCKTRAGKKVGIGLCAWVVLTIGPFLLFLFCAGGTNDQAKGRGENSGDWPAEAGKGSGRKKRPQPKLIFHESPGQPQRRPRREKRGLWSPERERAERKKKGGARTPFILPPPFSISSYFPPSFFGRAEREGKVDKWRGRPPPRLRSLPQAPEEKEEEDVSSFSLFSLFHSLPLPTAMKKESFFYMLLSFIHVHSLACCNLMLFCPLHLKSSDEAKTALYFAVNGGSLCRWDSKYEVPSSILASVLFVGSPPPPKLW